MRYLNFGALFLSIDWRIQADIDIENEAQERDISPMEPRIEEKMVVNVKPSV